MELAFGEACEHAAGITEHDTPGAEFVDEIRDQRVTGRFIAGLQGIEVTLDAL